jgi:N-acetylglucosaminyldiphosphoundecaprenol N-acetyl-beta-D-mannosaminyltransferase
VSAPAVPTFRVCGVEIATTGPAEAADYLVAAARDGRAVEAHLCNAYTLSLVDEDPELRAVLRRGTLNLCDGTPLSWLGRRHGLPGPVRGPGLVGDVAVRGVEAGIGHYLWGGAPGVAERMADRLRAHAPGLRVVGTESPPYHPLSDQELDEVAARVVSAGGQIVWVGLGTPKQDYIVPRLADRLAMPVVPIGAAFEFWSGAVKPPPRWVQGTGLEWIHRLLSEPRRLWRRYLVGNPKFVLAVWRHRS